MSISFLISVPLPPKVTHIKVGWTATAVPLCNFTLCLSIWTWVIEDTVNELQLLNSDSTGTVD